MQANLTRYSASNLAQVLAILIARHGGLIDIVNGKLQGQKLSDLKLCYDTHCCHKSSKLIEKKKIYAAEASPVYALQVY